MALGAYGLGPVGLGVYLAPEEQVAETLVQAGAIPNAKLDMPSLFYPNRKPVGKVKIDPVNEFSKGLTFLSGFGDKDLIKGVAPTLSSDVSKRGGTFLFNSQAADPAIGVNYGTGYEYIDGGMTVTVVASSKDWNASDNGKQVQGLIGATEASVLDGRWKLYVYNGDLVGFYDYGGNEIVKTSFSGILSNNVKHVITYATANKGVGKDSLWVNGRKIAVLTSENRSVPSSGLNLKFGSYDERAGNAYAGRLLGEIDCASIHNYRMTDDAIRRYHADVYQFLIPDRS